MKIHKTGFLKGAVKALIIMIIAVFTVTGCSLNPASSEESETKTTETVSVNPGNFDVYDYFEDVYGFNADTAYKYGDKNEAYYYSSYQHKTINDRYYTHKNYHPFSTLLYEEFQFLLQSQREEDYGYYLIVFGGEWKSKTASLLSAVNTVAAKEALTKNSAAGKDSYINTIYNFDFKLNGGIAIEQRLSDYGFSALEAGDNTLEKDGFNEYNTDIRKDLTSYGSGNNARTVTNLYKTLYDTLNVETDLPEGFVSGKSVAVKGGESLGDSVDTLNYINSPSVLLIKKEQVGGTVKNTVKAFADASDVDFSDSAKSAQFDTELNSVFAAIPEEGLKTFDFFKYIWGSYTQGSSTSLSYSQPENIPTKAFSNSFTGEDYIIQYDNLTDVNHIFETVTYGELIHLLNSEGNFAIYFGGSWCHYSRGFLAPLNQVGKSYDITKIYVFDPRIDGTNNSTNIRASEDSTGLYQRLYANLMTYLGVDYNSYAFPSSHDYLSNKLGVTDEDITIAGKKLTKIGVPTLIGYNKDNVDEKGNASPIVGTAETADNFETIVAEATEPYKYGSVWEVENAVSGVKYYKNVSYLEVMRTSVAGRRQENNIIRFLDDFYDGLLTYKVK